ncbi:MAG: YqjK family protein [Burkholderiales bacterium]|nr:YqjK family protein [Burkholderiales bacterium]
MGKTHTELAYERGRLLERIQYQRSLLARECAPLQRVAQKGDHLAGLAAELLAFARQNPLTLGAVAAVVLVFKPRMAWRMAKRGFFLWRGWRMVQQWQPGTLMQLLRRFI